MGGKEVDSRPAGTAAVPWLTLLAALLGLSGLAQTQAPNRAGVVVSLGDGRVLSRCVSFDAPQVSGQELLAATGLDVAVSQQGLGQLTCQIEGIGCPADDCLCRCRGGVDCVYWSYWHLQGDGWVYAQDGASAHAVRPGEVDGWAWAAGSVSQASSPPPTSFAEVCSAEAIPMRSTQSDAAAGLGGWPAVALLGGLFALLALLWAGWRRRAAAP
ncbi:MAG: hypothetical protein ACRDHL_01855 [Candidatus Promineifilaceae bacterium]